MIYIKWTMLIIYFFLILSQRVLFFIGYKFHIKFTKLHKFIYYIFNESHVKFRKILIKNILVAFVVLNISMTTLLI